MTRHRAAGPGPRTTALTHPRDLLLGLLLLAVTAVGCGGATPSVTPAAQSASTGASASPATGASAPATGAPGSAAPVGSAGPAASDGGPGAQASPPRWPGSTVRAVIALGAADAEIEKAGNDLQRAAASQDLKAIWGAADGLAKLIDELSSELDGLDAYAGTQPVAGLYRAAFPEIVGGAKDLRDAITSGDATRVVAGSQRLAKGLSLYGPIRPEIAGLVEQAIVQQRLLLR
jgi:hypothetical protein